MAGTSEGGRRAALTNKARHGSDFYRKIGARGGRNSNNGGFASDEVGTDGLTGSERARIVGARGGQVSKPRAHRVNIKKLDPILFTKVWNSAASSEQVAATYKMTARTAESYANQFRLMGHDLRALSRHGF